MDTPGVLGRIINNEFKSSDPATALTLPKLFHSTRLAIWSELEGGRNVSSLRRQLQRAHLDQLIAMVVNPTGPAPEDAKILAWDQLKQLERSLSSASRHSTEEYTRVHLAESRMRIARALEAKQTIGAAAPARGQSLIEQLLGGAKP